MSRLVALLVALLAAAAAFYQLTLKPILTTAGLWRRVESLANDRCTSVPKLQACEKIVLHQPTGILYLACSLPSSRTFWSPAVNRLDAEHASFDDYVATYDPASNRVTRLKFLNFNSTRGFSSHGMDIVQSSSNSDELFVYLINHRAPLVHQSAREVGADSTVEIFRTVIDSDSLIHIRTVQDPIIICPNDVVGYPDGQSFYFTNDHGEKVRGLEYFGRKSSSVGYCHAQTGCKHAITNMQGNNGIARAQNDSLYVVNSLAGVINILERQSDDTLVISDTIPTDRSLDNASIDSDGALWIAGFPDALTFLFKHFPNPSIPAPSSALRMTLNTGSSSFFGEKYKLEKVFEDSGSIASGTTSVVHDAQRHRLFLHGMF
ncbi:Serum paraoxonase/arylesterase 2 [Termitomyces sp. J132]|nr:Serum paraoxonase/arylesterase 2 [Termitomyces sp. J132]